MPSPNDMARPTSSPKPNDGDTAGPTPAFALPYRVVYAVATQDAVLVYDTQQQTPIAVVSNLHYATFTDVTWYGTEPRWIQLKLIVAPGRTMDSPY